MKRSFSDMENENETYQDVVKDMKCRLRYQSICFQYKNFMQENTHHVTRYFVNSLFSMFQQNFFRLNQNSDSNNNTYHNSLVVHVILSKILEVAFETTAWRLREKHNIQRAQYRKIKH